MKNALQPFDVRTVRFEVPAILFGNAVVCRRRLRSWTNHRIDLRLHLQIARVDSLQPCKFLVFVLERALPLRTSPTFNHTR